MSVKGLEGRFVSQVPSMSLSSAAKSGIVIDERGTVGDLPNI